MKAPTGRMVELSYDTDEVVEIGDVLQTRTGRCYLVVGARQQRRGYHVGRWHLVTVVVDRPPDGARIQPLFWYPRKVRNRS